MRLTKKQIEIVRKNTPKGLKGRQIGCFGVSDILGTYQPLNANWSYVVGYYNGVLVVTQFGEVV